MDIVVQNVRESYGELNLNTLYQQSARLTQSAQTMAQQILNTSAFQNGLVNQAGANQAIVAKILAEARAAEIALRAAQASSSVKETTTITKSGVVTNPPPMPGASDNGGADTQTVAAFLALPGPKRCIACHTGEKAKGGFQIGSYLTLDEAGKEAVISRLANDTNEKPRMPLGPDGKSAGRLPRAELRNFIDKLNWLTNNRLRGQEHEKYTGRYFVCCSHPCMGY